jgi:hypothetical protein
MDRAAFDYLQKIIDGAEPPADRRLLLQIDDLAGWWGCAAARAECRRRLSQYPDDGIRKLLDMDCAITARDALMLRDSLGDGGREGAADLAVDFFIATVDRLGLQSLVFLRGIEVAATGMADIVNNIIEQKLGLPLLFEANLPALPPPAFTPDWNAADRRSGGSAEPAASGPPAYEYSDDWGSDVPEQD